MNSKRINRHTRLPAALFGAILAALSAATFAGLTDLAPAPLGTVPAATVRPNLMFILDDSGSMGWDYLPDQVNDNDTCKTASSSSTNVVGTGCRAGYPPYYAAQFNSIYYNPQITYTPAVNYLNAGMGNQSPTAASNDPFVTGAGTKDIVTTWTDRVYCTSTVGSSPSASERADPAKCRRNGIDPAANPFNYASAGLPTTTFRVTSTTNGNPHYYTITPVEHCTDDTLSDCVASTTSTTVSGTLYSVPAPVRWCKASGNASAAAPVTGSTGTPATPRCQSKVNGNYPYPRFGTFTRTDIVPGTTLYDNRPNRTDCAARPNCTYAEELQNFANWYSYYSVRLRMMKTVSGRAFAPVDDRYRVGFITINAGSASKYLPIANFDATQKNNWYQKFYAQTANDSTPLREALARVGRHFAGVTTGINSFMPQDPMEYSCQKNFALLTTDGYWNGNAGQNTSGGAIGNQDNVANTAVPFYVSRPTGTLDGTGTYMTTNTPSTTLQQVVCSGNNGVFGTTCGCTGNLQRVKQQTSTSTQSVVTIDGVPGTPTTTTTNTYQNITSCDAQVVTTVTPLTEVQQVVCQGNNTANFSGSPDTTCGCSGSNRRIKQRTRNREQTVVTTDGAVTSDTTATISSTFQDFTTCASGTPTISLSPNPTITSGTPTSSSSGTTVTSANFTISPNPTTTTGSPTSTTTPGGTANTLADVAMYYYKTDLRPTMKDNVPTDSKNIAPHQHMVTFTLGLGLDGLMTYRSDYETATVGDFFKIKNGASGCSWTSSTCNWPVPVENTPTALDDLWHAAVNGRGLYFSAKNPNSLQDGLINSLATINLATGAAASSATSTPNITPSDNFIFSSTYRTVKWDGEVIAEQIDPTTGSIIPGTVWSARTLLNTQVSASSDTRAIHMFDSATATKLKAFDYAAMSSTEKAWFDNKCLAADLPQCGPLSAGDLASANNGLNLVKWLRGQTGNEGTLYRDREHVLGDTVNARPLFVGPPNRAYSDAVTPDYATFKSTGRQRALFISANDGMLHAFNSETGEELWAYAPRIVMPDLYKLAANNYDIKHRYYVDGSAVAGDAYIGGAWKTVLVGALNSGGRGYYALDITDPATPKGLWEICSDSSLCAISDADMGYSYGEAIITKRGSDGKWVALVTSGYNNVTTGDGRGYLYVLDLATGAVLDKITTGAGDTTTPSGFAKIAAFTQNSAVDNTALYIYGGDLLGNIWRFDMSVSPPTAQRIAQLKDGSSPAKPQSVTTRPEITKLSSGDRVLFFGTGRFLGGKDLPDPATLTPPENFAYQQSLYAFKDTGTDLGNLRAANLVQQQLTVIDAVTRSSSNNDVDWATKDGWFVDFNPANDSPGERINIDPQLVLGTLLVLANEPNSEACSTGGNSWFYQFSYLKGTYIASAPGMITGTKLSAALGAGFVTYQLPSGVIKATAITTTSQKLLQGVTSNTGGDPGKRLGWREVFSQ